ncbi:MAG: hypothetical protein ACK5IQ_10445 [Bacteroidales bacterium]
MRGAGDEAISYNKEQIATLTLAMTTNVDTKILQSYDVGSLWLQTTPPAAPLLEEGGDLKTLLLQRRSTRGGRWWLFCLQLIAKI